MASNQEHTCNVCCESFTDHQRKIVDCQYCPNKTCLKCTKTYLMETTQDAHCLNCRNAWNREFLDSILSRYFVDGKYKKQRECVLYEREKLLMPETMPFVEKYIIKKNINIQISQLKQEKIRAQQRQQIYNFEGSLEDKLNEYKRRQDNTQELFNFDKDIALLQYHLHLLNNDNEVINIERQKFVRACPANECRGFLSSQWKCGLCNVWVCPKCHEIIGKDKNVEHTCCPENIATAELLAKDSKPCPKCASMIFKVSGCSQMWCVQCHTTFDWKTGRIETGRVHNPHYYEYLRNTNEGNIPREQGDIPCGGLPEAYHIRMLLTGYITNDMLDNLLSIMRMERHIDLVEIPAYRADDYTDNRDLRIKYLAKEIDDDTLKRSLQQREKNNTRKKEIHMLLQMFHQVIVDIILRYNAEIVAELENKKVFTKITKTHLSEFERLRRYFNECAIKIGNRYGRQIINISLTSFGNWRIDFV